jgi:hypothetical protein
MSNPAADRGARGVAPREAARARLTSASEEAT